MIGRVPVLYLPGFFWPGQEFVFNPNVGYRSREGSFVQTTTYLVGRKPSQQAPFSFLQLTSTGAEGYDLEQHGLFLRKVPAKPGEKPTTDTLKLMLDAYSRLGVFSGFAGDFSPVATFRVALAASRDVFLDQSLTPAYYTPYLPDAVPDYILGQSVWNTSSLFGTTVPFRFGFDGSLKTPGDVASLSVGFQYFSDPAFTSDFYNRSEAGILANLSPTAATTQQQTAAQTALSWDLAGRLDFSRLINSPLASTVSVPTVGAHMAWQSRSPDTSTLNLVQQYDPGTAFYYPTSFTAPTISATFAGQILKLPAPAAAAGTAAAPGPPSQVSQLPAPSPAGKGQAEPPSAKPPAAGTASPPSIDPGKGLRYPPASTAPRQQAAPPGAAAARVPARIPLRPPASQPDAGAAPSRGVSTLTVSYQVQPRATLEHTFDSQGWTTRDSVDYAIRYRTFETGGSSTLNAAASLLDGLADISLGLTANALWRSRFDPSVTEAGSADWQSLMLADLQQDSVGLRSTLQGIVRPFQGISSLSASTLQYRLGVELYQLGYLAGSGTSNPVFTSPPIGWDVSTIAEHSFVSTLALNLPWTTDSFVANVQLPPLVPTVSGVLSLGAGPLTGKLQGGFTQPPAGIQYQPLVANLSAVFAGGITGSEEVVYDLANGNWQKSTSSVQLGPMSGSFIAQWMLPVDGRGNVITGSTEQFMPYSVRVGLETPGNPSWFWKNRIKAALSVKTHWTVNLQRYTDNLFDFGTGLTLSIFKGLDLTFSSYSTNNRTYRYFSAWAAGVGDPWVNPIIDLASSFAFWDTTARQHSSFKIRALSVAASQHFPDWDLTVKYDGSPQLRVDPADGRQKYMWTPTFSIVAQWKAVPEVTTNIKGDSEGVTLR
jgi:hypothetical protein